MGMISLLSFTLGLLITPVILVVAVFIPILGQILALLNLVATLAWWKTIGKKVWLPMLLGISCFMFATWALSSRMSEMFQILASIALMIGLPVSVLYFLLVSYQVAKHRFSEQGHRSSYPG